MNADLESMKENYNRAKRAAKLSIFNAKNAERLKFCEELEDVDRNGNVFRLAKQLVRKNRDVEDAGCMRPKKKSQVYYHPTNPNFWPDPKVFINIFLFLIKSCIMLFVVCQTKLGSLGMFYELETILHRTKYKFIGVMNGGCLG